MKDSVTHYCLEKFELLQVLQNTYVHVCKMLVIYSLRRKNIDSPGVTMTQGQI